MLFEQQKNKKKMKKEEFKYEMLFHIERRTIPTTTTLILY